jgi:hypothetical protein
MSTTQQPVTPTPQPPQKFVATADDLTPELLNEAIAQARRYDRNFANKDGSESIPVPARTCRLLGLAILHLNNRLTGGKTEEPQERGYFASTRAPVKKPAAAAAKGAGRATKPKAGNGVKKAAKAPAAQKTGKKAGPGPALTEEQTQAFETVKDILGAKQGVTTRLLSERGGWKSHNTGARHLKSLEDLGYIKKVGKQRVIALTGLEP